VALGSPSFQRRVQILDVSVDEVGALLSLGREDLDRGGLGQLADRGRVQLRRRCRVKCTQPVFRQSGVGEHAAVAIAGRGQQHDRGRTPGGKRRTDNVRGRRSGQWASSATSSSGLSASSVGVQVETAIANAEVLRRGAVGESDAGPRCSAPGVLVEELTDRELSILRMLAGSAS
jgi:hypothetical protein